MSGILPKNQEVVGSVRPAQKQNFSDIFEQDANLKANTAAAMKKLQEKDKPVDEAVTKLNDALSGKNEESVKMRKSLRILISSAKKISNSQKNFFSMVRLKKTSS